MAAWLRLLTLGLVAAVGSIGHPPAGDDDDVADIPSKELRAGKDDSKRYFLVGPRAGTPARGYGLIVVLPGGDGGADFHPFVKRIYKNAVPDGYLVAQPVAVTWAPKQAIVWPTDKSRVPAMQFTTEEFVDAVIKDVGERHRLDPARIFTLSWSSGGPAAYAVSLTSRRVTGSFIAMSVFRPQALPPLENAKGQAYYLYHSPDDRVCPYRMAEQAAKDLEQAGARVKLTSYDGGHGWRGPLYDAIPDGLTWLEEHHATREPEAKPLTPAEAIAQIGQPEVLVEMVVKKSKDRLAKRGLIYLDSEDDPKDAKNLGVAISAEAAAKFKAQGIADPAAHFQGKTVRVRDCVMKFEERPYLPVHDPGQIRVVEKKE